MTYQCLIELFLLNTSKFPAEHWHEIHSIKFYNQNHILNKGIHFVNANQINENCILECFVWAYKN